MASFVRPERAVDAALRSALSASGFVGTWETDLDTGTVYPSGAFGALFGIDEPRAEAGIPLETFFAGVHPDDRLRVVDAVRLAHRTAGRFESEFRMVNDTGVVRWVTARGQVETDGKGCGFRCLGVAIDVTDTRCADATSDPDAVRIINHLLDAMIAARTSIASLGTPILKHMIDMLLIQLGKEMKNRTQPNGDQRLH